MRHRQLLEAYALWHVDALNRESDQLLQEALEAVERYNAVAETLRGRGVHAKPSITLRDDL